MSNYEHEEKALQGLGVSVAAGGFVTIAGATSATTGIIATGLTNAVAMAPTAIQGAILAGQFLAATPLAPIVIIGGLGYALYHWLKS